MDENERRRLARIATLAIMAVALGLALFRSGALRPRAVLTPDPTPRDAIYGMLDAARAGDVGAYLASYTGQMAASLRQSVVESGEPAFAKYLRDSNAAMKGVAVSEPQPLSDREVKLRVEYVYQDRNEGQTVYLERAGRAWRIARVDSAERIKTLVPYGTPVQ